jgi:hypothetical protein
MNPVVERRGGDRRVGGRRSTDRAPSGIRCFTLRRDEDVSGVSGTGVVLEGTLFSTGVVVVHWLTPPPRGSIAIFDTLDQLLSIQPAVATLGGWRRPGDRLGLLAPGTIPHIV